MPLGLLFKRWFWCGLGLVTVLFGINDAGNMLEFLPGSETGTGIVQGVTVKTVEIGGRDVYLNRVMIDYQTPDGQTHLAELRDIDEKDIPPIGEEIAFAYDPENPTDIRHYTFYEKWVEWSMLIIFGIIILILGLWPGLAKLFRLFKSFGSLRSKSKNNSAPEPDQRVETPTIRRQ